MAGTYPPTISQLQTVCFKFPGLAKLDDVSLEMALDQATAEIETVVPWAATTGALSDRLNKSVWVLALDIAVWRLRWTVERDSETNDVPKALQTQRKELTDRLNSIQIETPKETNTYKMAVFDPLCAPEFPENNRMF